jgi:lambda family phage portal protein
MKLIPTRLSRAFVAARSAWSGKRGYDAARVNRLTADWLAYQTSADAEIRNDFPTLVNRCRDLERNNDYVRGFLNDADVNVIGCPECDVQMNIADVAKDGTSQPDARANRMVQEAWMDWCKASNCSANGQDTWHDTKKLALRAVIRDGNILVEHIEGAAAGNRFNYAVALWEVDQLDFLKNEKLSNGGKIRFGVETNSRGRPVAYWLRTRHPGDQSLPGHGDSYESRRFEARLVHHAFMRERPNQTLGVPWFISAITRLRRLGSYEEAELIAANVGAMKMGFYKRTPDASGAYQGDGKQSDGALLTNAEPGSFEELPPGYEVQTFNPDHPNQNFGNFRKACLMGISTALGVSYVTLGNDLEAVNFSSARVGLLDEREQWKMIQKWFTDHFLVPIFERWLFMALASGAIQLPLSKFDKFNKPLFKSRRWAWVDPQKEIEASIQAVQNGFGSRRQIIGELGGDISQVFADIAADNQLAEKHKLKFPDGNKPTSQAEPALEAEEDPSENEDE